MQVSLTINSVVFFTTLFVLGVSSGDSTGSTNTEGRGGSKIDLLFSVNSDHEGRNIDELLSDSEVSLSDHDSSVMDRSGVEVALQDDGLESSFHELGDGKTQNVIELVFFLGEETKSETSSHEGSTFENSLGIIFLEGQEFSSGLS